MKSLFLILMLAVTVSAQESNFRVAARCGLAHGSGFENPICGGEAGGTVGNGKVALDFTTAYLFAKKIPGDGHNVSGDATLRIHIGRSYFIGPAIGYARQTTNQYVKSGWSAGAEGGRVSPSGNVVLSARFLQDVTSVNKQRSYTAKLEYYGPKRIYLGGRGGLQDFRCNQTANGLADHCWGGSTSASLGFYFK